MQPQKALRQLRNNSARPTFRAPPGALFVVSRPPHTHQLYTFFDTFKPCRAWSAKDARDLNPAMSAMTPAERKRLERQADNLSSNTAIFAPVQYNYPAPSHDASGIAAQDYAFVQELQRRAVPPATSDVVRRAAHDLWKNSSKSALAVQIPELVFDPPTFDVHVVRNSEDLSKVLRRPFSFIFIPRSSGLVNTHGWTIEKQVAALGAGKGQAYQPSKKTARGGQSTHNVGHSALKSFLDAESRKPEHSGINFLDICNPTKFYFPPAEVHSVSLVDQIRDYNFSESWGRGKAPERDRSDEWTILTGGPSSSPWHNDHGGQTTVVVGLEGEKIWHGVSGDWETARKRFYVNGFRGCNYPNGIFHITLGPGDCL